MPYQKIDRYAESRRAGQQAGDTLPAMEWYPELKAKVAHGTLMTVAFVVLMNAGVAVAAGTIGKMSGPILYLHVGLQIAGVLMATIGFILCFELFLIPYEFVDYSHGKLGIAVMALCYFQALAGFVRPKRKEGADHRGQSVGRRVFDVAHLSLGRVVVVLGIFNCFTGILVTRPYIGVEKSAVWAGLSVAAIILTGVVGSLIQRYGGFDVVEIYRQAVPASTL